MWDLPGPGLEPLSPASAGRLSTTAPPGKPRIPILLSLFFLYFFCPTQVRGEFLAFWEVWGLLPAFSRCSVAVVPHVDVFLMYLWGGMWSPRLTLLPSWSSSFWPFFSIEFFVFLLVSCMSSLCILEIKPLLVASFANIFSQSKGCLFISFMVSFAVQKLISLIRFHCLILLLFLLSWETDVRKHWYDLCQRMVCLCSLLGVLWCHVLHVSL